MGLEYSAILLTFIIGGGLVTMMSWSTVKAYTGDSLSRLRKWIAGITGGTGASVVAIYTQYVDGLLIPAWEFFKAIVLLNWDGVTLWGFYTFIGILGTQVIPVIVIVINYIQVGKAVHEPVKQKRKKSGGRGRFNLRRPGRARGRATGNGRYRR